MTTPRLGIFGGTFDPVHHGHINTVTSLLDYCSLDHVYLVPAAVSPHKSTPSATGRQRFEMLQLAIADVPQITVDDRELLRDGPSFTYDTIELFRQDFPANQLCLIVGLDAFITFDHWYRYAELLESVHIIVMRRPGWDIPTKLPEWWASRKIAVADELDQSESGKILLVDVEPHPVSATEIRYAISQGIDVSTLVAEPVWDYIQSRNLYL